MTTQFDNMNTKQLLATLNALREQNDIAVLKHAKSRELMIAEIVKLSPVASSRKREYVTALQARNINAKVARSLFRRHDVPVHHYSVTAYDEIKQTGKYTGTLNYSL